MTSSDDSPRFEIAADVVFRLGEELITDVVQALVELVKNSYDADASWSRVMIRTPDTSAAPDTPEALGTIVVEDNGHGMSESDWLMIARSTKREAKVEGKTTKRGRTPIGDKGLGRLGVHRLGHNVKVVSRTKDSPDEIVLTFSWRNFQGAAKLSEVPVELESHPRSKSRPGTTITVTDLKNPEQWSGDDARVNLQKSLSELLSPFREVQGFSVTVELDGDVLPIAELAEQVRDAAVVRYEFSYRKGVLSLSGRVRLDYVMRARKREDRQLLQDLMRQDHGRSYFQFMGESTRRGRPPDLEYDEGSAWILRFSFSEALAEMDGVKVTSSGPADPGPFHGAIDYLLLDSEEFPQHVWDTQAEFREYAKGLAGIRVYRDGFGIRVGEDWLNLGGQQTSGRSQYALRPKNVVGFIALSARDNQNLQETTSRQDFQQTPHFLNFYALLQRVIEWSSSAQEYLRRSSLDYLRDCKERAAGVNPSDSEDDIRHRVRKTAQALDRKGKAQQRTQEKIKTAVTAASSTIQDLTEGDQQFQLFHKNKIEKLNLLLSNLQDTLVQVEKDLVVLESETSDIDNAEKILAVLEERHQRTMQELELFYEGVALGLTAEALSHEIGTIAHRLAKKASAVASHLAAIKHNDAKVLSFVEHVKSSVAALRRQLAHLDPALRYVREQRSVIAMAAELREIQDFYKERLRANSISLNLTVVDDFHIIMNRGKFNQVLDNLILNSEYWLKELARRSQASGRRRSGTIFVEVARPYTRVWDDGTGVPLSVEDTLFDPFVTTKRKGRGRGLGLFIVQQLLDAEACTIALLLKRNEHDRRFKFEIDFRGALHE